MHTENVKSTGKIKAFLCIQYFQYKFYHCDNICPALCSHTLMMVLVFLYYTTLISVQKASIISGRR